MGWDFYCEKDLAIPWETRLSARCSWNENGIQSIIQRNCDAKFNFHNYEAKVLPLKSKRANSFGAGYMRPTGIFHLLRDMKKYHQIMKNLPLWLLDLISDEKVDDEIKAKWQAWILETITDFIILCERALKIKSDIVLW